VDTQTVSPTAPAAVEHGSGGVDPKTGMVESVFIATLRATLITKDEDDAPWPPKALRRKREKVLAEMTTMFGALFKRIELHKKLPPGRPKSALRIVSDMLKGSRWPKKDAKFPLPLGYDTDEDAKTFRRYEATCAMALFYQAYGRCGRGDAGGSPVDWPPKD
jgi:hypothetical protein